MDEVVCAHNCFLGEGDEADFASDCTPSHNEFVSVEARVGLLGAVCGR